MSIWSRLVYTVTWSLS